MSNTSVISSHSYGVFVQLLDLETKSRMEKGVQGITSLDTYFAKMREIVTEKKTSSRVRFLMQDVIGKWPLELSRKGASSRLTALFYNDRSTVGQLGEAPRGGGAQDHRGDSQGRSEGGDQAEAGQHDDRAAAQQEERGQEQPEVGVIADLRAMFDMFGHGMHTPLCTKFVQNTLPDS